MDYPLSVITCNACIITRAGKAWPVNVCYYKGMYEEPPELPCKDKLAFDHQRDAQAAATVAFHRFGTRLKVYICRYCGLWHLSSQPDDDYS